MMELSQYITELDKIYRAGNATEHSYRHALLTLLVKITSGLNITNEPKHIECGAPDYIITRNDIPLGYIEAKDISVGIHHKANKEQFDRYRKSLSNLIITDYLTFQLYVEGEAAVSVTIAEEKNGGIVADKKQFDVFLALIEQFVKYSGTTIYQSEPLARIMADKAKLLASIIKNALKGKADNDTLTGQYEGFKKILIHNLGIDEFADIYAQTLAYGLFAARLNQSDSRSFTRYLAAHLIPQSNPFLRKFFNYIAGIELDSRIIWIVDALADMFNCVATEEIKKEFGKTNQDPYIHFYETFLAEYNPKLRESRGVYYTPLPVVKFIVNAVDNILKNEFGLGKGLAESSKIKRIISSPDEDKKEVEFHKVQILDPATGTGTFLAEVIDKIYAYFEYDKGAWTSYCDNHLIPRLNGFEILMASYAMAHFKLDMKLKEKDLSRNSKARLNVYLTNALEEAPENVPELFMAQWLAEEAKEARRIKRDVPVMVVMANPPYNVSTQNKNDWIDNLIMDYKKEPETEARLNERKLNLDDDYVKFIRYGQYLIERIETGILAYINNHGFLDNPTFRGMRWNLLKTFDKIYVLNLHGNSKKKETAPDGSKDENVFDIQQGVSINFFIKNGKKKDNELAKLFHADLFGIREKKYLFLLENCLESIHWLELCPVSPSYYFVPKDFNNQDEYNKGFSLKELFPLTSPGIKTERDNLTIHFTDDTLKSVINDFCKMEISEIKVKYNLGQNSRDWKIEWAKKDLTEHQSENNIMIIHYRPFDYRYTFYTGKSKGFIGTPGFKVVKHFLAGSNLGLIFLRNMPSFPKWSGIFITDKPVEFGIGGSFPGNTAPIAPLYLYPDKDNLDNTAQRHPNLNMDIVNKIAEKISLRFTEEKENVENTFAPIDILDYIYAVLYSIKYREIYKEFLKINFPRIPYPSNAGQFQKLVSIGSLLRNLHLMEKVNTVQTMANFPIAGTNEVETVKYSSEKAWINKTQYFDNVPQEIWEYYIGGYQSAQKWLKDRKGRKLSFDDMEHYRKIISVLKMTIELQRQIDEVIGDYI